MRILRSLLVLIASVLLFACSAYYGEGYYSWPYHPGYYSGGGYYGWPYHPGYYSGHFLYRQHLHDRGPRLDSRHDVHDGKVHHHDLREDHHDGPGVHHLHNGKVHHHNLKPDHHK